MGKRFTEDQLVLIKEICSEVVARCMEYERSSKHLEKSSR